MYSQETVTPLIEKYAELTAAKGILVALYFLYELWIG